MINKKMILLLVVVLCTASLGFSQMSEAINFFSYNICGTGQTVSWRGSCHTSDNPSGGYHDAGDHVKFNLPMAFSAAMMSWAAYEYGASGVSTPVSRILSYLRSCGTSGSIKYQVGDPGADHGYWGPPEDQTGTRPTSTGSKVSCVAGGTAAAFAIASVAGVSGGDMNTAKTLYSMAENSKSDDDYTAANGFYQSHSGFYDELVWAAIWIYLGTKDTTYLAKAEQYFEELNDDYQWTYCWDDCRYGAVLKLAQITQKEVYIEWIERHLDWWNDGGINMTGAGLPWLDSWGCLRYASAAGFLLKLWADSPVSTDSKRSGYRAMASKILSYIKGSNPAGRSYIIGVGSNYPRCPHHRAACPSKTCPCEYTLTGGLVGGPDQSDQYQDSIDQYQYSEVALDYNACLVALIACQSGGSPPQYEPTSPPTPTPTPGPTAQPGTGNGLKGEYYSGTGFGTLVMTRTDATINFNWGGDSPGADIPSDGFSVRWTGEIEPVYTDTYTFYENSDDGGRVYINNQAVIDRWEDHAAEEYSGTISLNAGQRYSVRVEYYENSGDATMQFSWSSTWQEKEIVPQSRLYSESTEPTPGPTDPPTNPPVTNPPNQCETMGDVNGDGTANIVDALEVAQYYVGVILDFSDATARACADVNCSGTIDIVDALLIAQYYVGLITDLDC
ncbi:MAG: glycoside hydrolase family 9 protein [Spirochaetales bacterium]|nr:glycoside hydrolase family 9 protein [Spirochaetales bacterium]